MENKIIKRELFTTEPLQVREGGNGEQSRTIEGYAILFNTASVALYEDERHEVREVIAPEAVSAEFLNGCDIKMTMFHNRELILARSNKGNGSLSYKVDDKGVSFSFDAPRNADGEKALELVRRGDIAGCSFAFSTYYDDEDFVSSESQTVDGKKLTYYTVKRMLGIHDMALAADPAYPDTSCWARELVKEDHPAEVEQPKVNEESVRAQVEEMRQAAQLEL